MSRCACVSLLILVASQVMAEPGADITRKASVTYGSPSNWAMLSAVEETACVYPDTEDFWTGRVRHDGAKWSRNLAIIHNPDFRGWARFDLSTIPDSVVITGVAIRYYFLSSTGDCSAYWRHLLCDPLTTSGDSLYAACGSSTVVSDSTPEPVAGCTTRIFNVEGVNAVQNGLVDDWVAFAWHRAGPYGRRYASGYEGGEQKPRLTVVFSPPVGTHEQEPTVSAFRPVLVPSPVRGEHATVRLAQPLTSEACLTLCDAMGRSLLEQTVSPSGVESVDLDVTALGTGTYLLILRTQNTQEVRKLVIQR